MQNTKGKKKPNQLPKTQISITTKHPKQTRKHTSKQHSNKFSASNSISGKRRMRRKEGRKAVVALEWDSRGDAALAHAEATALPGYTAHLPGSRKHPGCHSQHPEEQ